eukprot:6241911-Amphidinium_carterae.1
MTPQLQDLSHAVNSQGRRRIGVDVQNDGTLRGVQHCVPDEARHLAPDLMLHQATYILSALLTYYGCRPAIDST